MSAETASAVGPFGSAHDGFAGCHSLPNLARHECRQASVLVGWPKVRRFCHAFDALVGLGGVQFLGAGLAQEVVHGDVRRVGDLNLHLRVLGLLPIIPQSVISLNNISQRLRHVYGGTHLGTENPQ